MEPIWSSGRRLRPLFASTLLVVLALNLKASLAVEQHTPKPISLAAAETRATAHPSTGLVDAWLEKYRNVSATVYTPGHKYLAVFQHHTPGFGNRLPGIVSAFLLALVMDRRLVFNEHSSSDQLESHFDFVIPIKTQREWYREHNPASFSGPKQFLHDDVNDPKVRNATVVVTSIDSDYIGPLLVANPSTRDFMKRYFPDYEIFHPLSRQFIKPRPENLKLAYQFASANFYGRYVVGIQLRTMKIKVDPLVFFRIAQGVGANAATKGKPVLYFILADVPNMYAEAAAFFGEDNVAWTHNAVGSGSWAGMATNPGTFDDAVVDMWLLSLADAAVISHGSSFGYTGAAFAGIKPVYVYSAGRDPFFFQALSSEPCFWAARGFFGGNPDGAAMFRAAHPHWTHFFQCHP